jgi:hypothetical protein
MSVVGMAFEDFDHNDVGLKRGSPQVATVLGATSRHRETVTLEACQQHQQVPMTQ